MKSMPPWPPIFFASSPMRLKSGCSYCATNFSHASPSVHSWKLPTPSMARRFG